MSELKCPFCQQKLGRKNINDRMCSNEKCVSWKGNFYGSEDLWQELICTRKALDVAIDALKDTNGYLYGDYRNTKWDLHKTIRQTLEQITALEQKDK